jgi:hypothetical protein
MKTAFRQAKKRFLKDLVNQRLNGANFRKYAAKFS